MTRKAMRATTMRWAAAVSALSAAFGVLMLPAAWALLGRGSVALDGIATLDDAVAACRRSGLAGWELVTYAQHLVFRGALAAAADWVATRHCAPRIAYRQVSHPGDNT